MKVDILGMRKIIIEDKVFEMFPEFKRGLIIISNIQNFPANSEIEKLLKDAIAGKTRNVEDSYIKAWEEAYVKFGSNPNKFPPSIKSLIKRIDKGGNIPFINSVVALFNYISIKYFIPCGGDDTEKIEGNLKLGISGGSEKFIPLGGTESESPDAGEVIYYDDKTLNVMCRRWNWRNGDFTKITENTKKLVINLDGAGVVPQDLILAARNELCELLVKFCQVEAKTDLLNKEKKEVEIEI